MRIGLTGGVASGKSTVSARLAERGALVIDADLLAREVVARGTPGLRELVDAFGEEILTDDGELDRPAMARRVFGDEAARRTLEGVIHPRVRAEGRRREEAALAADPDTLVVHDIPLLAETGQAGSFDAVVVVDAPEEQQVARMVADRGWDDDEARARIRAQASRDERLAVATHVLDNSGSREDLLRRVDELYDALTAS